MWSVPRSYFGDNWGDQECSVRESVKRAREAEEPPLLVAIARERLVQTP
jgi:hypothetical protein